MERFLHVLTMVFDHAPESKSVVLESSDSVTRLAQTCLGVFKPNGSKKNEIVYPTLQIMIMCRKRSVFGTSDNGFGPCSRIVTMVLDYTQESKSAILRRIGSLDPFS